MIEFAKLDKDETAMALTYSQMRGCARNVAVEQGHSLGRFSACTSLTDRAVCVHCGAKAYIYRWPGDLRIYGDALVSGCRVLH